MIAAVAPWNSIGFQIIVAWIAFILVACWLGGRLEKARAAERQRWRDAQDRRRPERVTRNGRAA